MVPPWVNRKEFPFTVHTHDTPEGRMSYVDEGRGRPLVFVHGNATWSYLYRHLIRDFARSHRCVALDFLGFGLSEKPLTPDYGPRAHVRRLGEFLDKLGLEDVTLVVHDYGGPIGFAWALDHPERVRNLVLFNTWLWSLADNPMARRLAKLYGSAWNRWYYARLPAGPKFFLPTLIADAHTMSKRELGAYLLPFSEVRERKAPYDLAAGLVSESPWFDSLWARREVLRDKPAQLIWGEADSLARADDLDLWKSALPDYRVLRIDGARNFVPEDAALLSAGAMHGFLERELKPKDL